MDLPAYRSWRFRAGNPNATLSTRNRPNVVGPSSEPLCKSPAKPATAASVPSFSLTKDGTAAIAACFSTLPAIPAGSAGSVGTRMNVRSHGHQTPPMTRFSPVRCAQGAAGYRLRFSFWQRSSRRSSSWPSSPCPAAKEPDTPGDIAGFRDAMRILPKDNSGVDGVPSVRSAVHRDPQRLIGELAPSGIISAVHQVPPERHWSSMSPASAHSVASFPDSWSTDADSPRIRPENGSGCSPVSNGAS